MSEHKQTVSVLATHGESEFLLNEYLIVRSPKAQKIKNDLLKNERIPKRAEYGYMLNFASHRHFIRASVQ